MSSEDNFLGSHVENCCISTSSAAANNGKKRQNTVQIVSKMINLPLECQQGSGKKGFGPPKLNIRVK